MNALSTLLSPDMAKLSSEKIVQETNHRWHSPLYLKEDVTRHVVEVGGGNLFSFLSVPSTSTSSASRSPDIPKVAPITPDPEQDLMVFV